MTPKAPAPTADARPRRASIPPPPSIPLLHPRANDFASNLLEAVNGDRPLLAIPETGHSRHSASTQASLQIERRDGSEQRISLPPFVHHSQDDKRASFNDTNSLVFEPPVLAASKLGPVEKGKGKDILAVMNPNENVGARGTSRDLERGHDTLPRQSVASRLSGIGSVVSSSNSSIMGDPDQVPNAGEGWGPQHPCYPHLNPHVPVNSPAYAATRIIRVRRDWLLEGDLAPTFSNLYPEILDPAGLPEQEFRRVIEKLNGELVPTFNPYNWRNVVDGMLGLATGWISDDLGLTGAKSRLRGLEKWIEQWNLDMERTMGSEEGVMPPKLISLRRTGYMTVRMRLPMAPYPLLIGFVQLDIQIPDPEVEVATAPPSSPSAPRSDFGAEPAAAETQ